MPASAYETLTFLTMDNLKMNIGGAPRVELTRARTGVVDSLTSGDKGAP
ncbi:hypothetical protein GPL21_31870 [Bradyrhizobium pachyrhizi]|uniref:Uncharacterized protein n=1 Tax=Bradyrhizobium pachyrhizi TaxID=280333 RepID=A0A844T2D2_9BRAD|nr:hypothetical protein [Bradyrhizobium pachyrhizi]MVT69682.1 hypothetical protein [Bradyrhizobium pachyrhizi]WFU56480.1 hypothetical protein QA639_02785 [Bradyrhizobium pachyrhizi]